MLNNNQQIPIPSKLIGLDPGQVNFGWAAVEFTEAKPVPEIMPSLIDSGHLKTVASYTKQKNKSWDRKQRLLDVQNEVNALAEEFGAEGIVMERLMQNMRNKLPHIEPVNHIISGIMLGSNLPVWFVTAAGWKRVFLKNRKSKDYFISSSVHSADAAVMTCYIWNKLLKIKKQEVIKNIV